MAMFVLYETLRSFDGCFALLPWHQRRLEQACRVLNIPCPDLQLLVKPFVGIKDVRVRVDVDQVGGVGLSTQVLPEWKGSFLYPELWKITFVEFERERPEFKWSEDSALRNLREAHPDFDECLLVDSAGFVREGSLSSVWLIQNGVLVTPAEDVLPGVARAFLLESAERAGLPVELRALNRTDFESAEAVFLSNAVRGLVATGPVHPLMQRLAEEASLFIQSQRHA